MTKLEPPLTPEKMSQKLYLVLHEELDEDKKVVEREQSLFVSESDAREHIARQMKQSGGEDSVFCDQYLLFTGYALSFYQKDTAVSFCEHFPHATTPKGKCLPLKDCEHCPHMRQSRHYTEDSFEYVFNWHCRHKNVAKKKPEERLIGSVEGFDKAPKIPAWCPLPDYSGD